MKKIVVLLLAGLLGLQGLSAQTAAPEDMNPDDKVFFTIQMASMGLVLGTQANLAFSPNEINVGYELLGGGLGSGLGILAGWDGKVKLGSSVLTYTGFGLGQLEGFLLYSLAHEKKPWSIQEVNQAMGFGGLAGALSGYLAGELFFDEAGPALMVSTLSSYSVLVGALAASYQNWEGGDLTTCFRNLQVNLAVAGAAGPVAGLLVSGIDHFTPGDAYVIQAIYGSGSLAALGQALNIPFQSQPNGMADGFRMLRDISSMGIAGSTLALAGGIAVTYGWEYTKDQGFMVNLATLPGYLIGAGVAAIAKANKPGDYFMAMGFGALAASGGLALAYRLGDKPAVTALSPNSSNLPQLTFNPAALLPVLTGAQAEAALPAVSLAFRL